MFLTPEEGDWFEDDDKELVHSLKLEEVLSPGAGVAFLLPSGVVSFWSLISTSLLLGSLVASGGW